MSIFDTMLRRRLAIRKMESRLERLQHERDICNQRVREWEWRIKEVRQTFYNNYKENA